MAKLSLFVVSDTHVDSDHEREDSYALTRTNVGDGQSPLHDLKQLVLGSSLRADYLINAGDLSNKADTAALAFGWEQLTDIAAELGAATLAVPGNHDLITRRPAMQRRAALQGLRPAMPTLSAQQNKDFWDKGWVIYENDIARFLLIDSTFGFPPFPEGVDEDTDEFQDYLKVLNRGVFSSDMQQQVLSALKGLDAKLNVAILHHHPLEHQHKSFLQDTYGPMQRGSELIELLASLPNLGRWFVVHGHKHLPQLVTAATDTSNGPFMLCAGSASAVLWHPVNTVARNQVHLVELTDEASAFEGSLRGTVRSWSWGFGMGWTRASGAGIELPYLTGFGSSDDFRIAGKAVMDVIGADAKPHWSWVDIVSSVPNLPYMSPRDQAFLLEYLCDRGVRVLLNTDGSIQQIVKEPK